MQSLKETFAAKLPQEIEKIKKLRKWVNRQQATETHSDIIDKGVRIEGRRRGHS